MIGQRLGRTVRALRRKRGWRQTDLATRSRCSQHTISMIERGHLSSLSVGLLERTLAALDATLGFEVWWRGGALDRLLDEDHAALVARVAAVLSAHGWLVQIEVTYSEFGERGSYDILAFHAATGTLLAIEVKTDIVSIEATARKLDEKVRLAPTVALKRFGWTASGVARLLVVADSSTARRRAARHATILGTLLPDRGRAVRSWIARPSGSLAGLWFVSPRHPQTLIQHRGGRERVRVPRQPPPRHAQTARRDSGGSTGPGATSVLDKSSGMSG